MFKMLLTGILFCFVSCTKGLSQSSIQPGISTVVYHPPSADKPSWQRLNLWLSATFILAVKEGQVDLDSCLLMASRSLGMSRLSILAEGIDDPGLLSQSQWIDSNDPGKAIHLLSQATGTKHLQGLLLLGSYYVFQPGSYHRYRDSVEYFLGKAADESKTLKEERWGRQALCLLGKLYTQGNDKKADSVFKALIDQCKAAHDKETEARALAYRGIYTPVSPVTVQSKITDLQQAAELYHTLNNTEGEINVLTDIGYLLIVTGQLQPAYDVFIKALQLGEKIQYPYIHYNTDAIAMVTIFEGKFGEPLKYILQTIKVAESNRDSIGWPYFYSRLSILYSSEGRVKESLDMAKKAIARFVVDRNPAAYNMLTNVLKDMDDEGRRKEALDLTLDVFKKVNTPVTFTDQFFYHAVLASYYTSAGKLDSAAMHVSKMDSMETKAEYFRGPLRRSMIDDQYAIIDFKRGQYQKAGRNFEKHFTTPSASQRNLSTDLSVYRWLIAIDSALGDNTAGVVHYKRYTRLLDSSFRVTKRRQAEELQVLYQTEEKENQIASLNQRAELEQANLKQATLVKNLTIAGIIAALIIAGLLFRQSRLRKKNNTVITHKNEQLQHFLTEKEWLLKEIHHRVKNNLQIVMSLLNSQSAYIDNEPALSAIHDSQHRVHAMSLIHQKLYSSENVSCIDMPNYIRELVSYLADSFNTGRRIRFEYDTQPLEMDVSQAVPVGLILNEAITNSIKYAFPDDRDGVIIISLCNTSPNHYLLIISDNGIGMPAQPAIKKTGSLGMSLMAGLAEDLEGKFTIENDNGTIIKISFVHDVNIKRPEILVSSN